MWDNNKLFTSNWNTGGEEEILIKHIQRGYKYKCVYPRNSTDPSEDRLKPKHTKTKLLKTAEQEKSFRAKVYANMRAYQKQWVLWDKRMALKCSNKRLPQKSTSRESVFNKGIKETFLGKLKLNSSQANLYTRNIRAVTSAKGSPPVRNLNHAIGWPTGRDRHEGLLVSRFSDTLVDVGYPRTRCPFLSSSPPSSDCVSTQ